MVWSKKAKANKWDYRKEWVSWISNSFPFFQVLAAGVAVVGVAGIAINEAHANIKQLKEEDARLSARIDALRTQIAFETVDYNYDP